ncbi:CoA-transferase [Sphingomonas sp. CCH9-F2]|jgi:3-oxoadipate CoA-transferase alpha subunit|uniref:CoA-transferase n=1 Tax=Sphingomonas sp. CCH9-F2 TaxID=1768778 RepID=UPI000AB24AB8|nr:MULTISPECIES: CoA-transferase [Sphingomonas]
MAADRTIVQVRQVVSLGSLDPEAIVTPSIFVDRVVEITDPISERDSLLALDHARKEAAA